MGARLETTAELDEKDCGALIRSVSLGACGLLVVFLPVCVWLSSQLRFGPTQVEAWLPADDDSREIYREFRNRFGEDRYLLMSWPGCRLGDPRLTELSESLQDFIELRPELGIRDVVDSNVSASALSKNLEAAFPDAVERSVEVRRRLRGRSIGKGDEGVLILKLKPLGVEELASLLQELRVVATRVLGLEAQHLILAGEPVQMHEIDQATRRAMKNLVPPSSLLAFLVACLCLRSLPMTLVVLILAGIGQLIGMAVVAGFVGEIAAVLVVIPTLVFMLTLSACVHLANYYRSNLGQSEMQRRSGDSGVHAFKLGWKPCLLASLTTACGFVSLMNSQLIPVWQFGLLSALGLVISTCVALACFPALSTSVDRGWSKLSLLMVRPGPATENQISTPQLSSARLPSVGAPAASLGAKALDALQRFHFVVVSVCGMLLLVSIWGLTKIRSSTEFEDMFAPSSTAVESLRWMNARFGSLDTLEILVNCQTSAEENGALLEELGMLAEIERSLEASSIVDSVFTAHSLLPPLPEGRGIRSTVERAVYRRKLETQLSELSAGGLLSYGEGQRLWRITVRVLGFRGASYPDFEGELASRMQKVVMDFNEKHPKGEQAAYSITGLRAVTGKTQNLLLSDLILSFAAAFLLITPIMMLIVRGIGPGLLLMLPNVLPVALVFGTMGWLGIRLDVASILTASVALGIAVDDTLHFMHAYMSARRRGENNRLSVRTAMQICARPMLQTTLICTAAMAPFFWSDFLPTSKFALLMISILFGAILGDLILLPALLSTRFGQTIGATTR